MPKSFDVRDVRELWDKVPATDMLTEAEYRQLFPVFYDALEDMRYGVNLRESQSFQEFLDDMGLTSDSLGGWWAEFRDWYDAL
jgi:hypothetical protein